MKKIYIILILIAVIIIIIIFSYQYFRDNINKTIKKECNISSDCINTCCGCISKNDLQCKGINCIALPIRNCECINNQCREQLLIDSKERAIEFAKKIEGFIQAINKFERDFSDSNIMYNAYFDDKNNYWDVSVWPSGVMDLWYFIKFSKQGVVIEQGYGEGA